MKDYYYQDKEFIIKDYDKQKEFTSFLTAIAGKKGIPLWCFFINRGEGITSFGVSDKNGAILEFYPAYTAYETVNRVGFRTFLKIDNKYTEAFSVDDKQAKREIHIKREKFSIIEENKIKGYKIKITYFTLPEETVPALVRKVEFTNISNKRVNLKMLDGLTQIFPPSTNYLYIKMMANLERSFMEADRSNNFAFYKRSMPDVESVESSKSTEGNFYLSFMDDKLIKPIVDTNVIFSYDSSMTKPFNFIDDKIDSLDKTDSYPFNKIPCGFSLVDKEVKINETITLTTLIGNTKRIEDVIELKDKISKQDYINNKEIVNSKLVDDLTKDLDINTKDEVFNEYIKQAYFDNILRGGYPFHFIDNNAKDHIFYLYSRKHGDPERDYNLFLIKAEYYSSGNGDFRDILQNRRVDSMIDRNVKEYNLKYFFNLVQLDGYNPVKTCGETFTIKDKANIKEIVNHCFKDINDAMFKHLSSRFTPGSIVNTINYYNIDEKISEDEYLSYILTYSVSNIEATYYTGYWTDHFNYLLDLYESYIKIYPDNIENVLFNDTTYSFYDSVASIKPRSSKYVLNKDNLVRQYDAVDENDQVKINKFNLNKDIATKAKTKDLKVIETNLVSKMFSLAYLKFNLLDPFQLGIEMEANKPGWNDAMNGLPGLFGSGLTETFELLRIVKTLIGVAEDYPDKELYLPKELCKMEKDNMNLLKKHCSSFDYWDEASSLREEYRAKLRTGLSRNITFTVKDTYKDLLTMKNVLDDSIKRAYIIGDGIYPTYFRYEATSYSFIKDSEGNKTLGYKGFPLVKVEAFKRVDVKKFLEAPSSAYKVVDNKTILKDLYKNVKESEIYDKVLKTYKTSEPLDDETYEIGRIKAFNKGWQERESNFMHMTYKYLYGLLKAGLYKEFYHEAKTCLVCNMDPKVYGRSILEHSSFIESSASPDKDNIGRGFVTRLSGSTSEALLMYMRITLGEKPFDYDYNELRFKLEPALKKSFFKDDKTLSFTFLKDVRITYINEKMVDTFNRRIESYTLIHNDESIKVKQVIGDLAIKVRDGYFNEIIARIE